MPKIYEYLGILIFFYSHEHEPIHVHARCNGCECKAEFIIKEGKVVEILIRSVGNSRMLKSKDLRNFNDFLKVYSSKIVEKWIEYFVLNKKPTLEKITKRLK
jgi:hypothetical protein